jgi:hypothetical protein
MIRNPKPKPANNHQAKMGMIIHRLSGKYPPAERTMGVNVQAADKHTKIIVLPIIRRAERINLITFIIDPH